MDTLGGKGLTKFKASFNPYRLLLFFQRTLRVY